MKLLLGDVSNMSQVEDGTDLGKSLVLVLRQSKTDKYSENATVILAACPGHELCPVMWVKRYLNRRCPGATFFTGTGGGKPMGCALANTKPNFIIKDWLKRIGVTDTRMYGSHSLRKGGVHFSHVGKSEPSHRQAPRAMEK